MEKLERGDKIYLDENNIKGSLVNSYLDCRDGYIEVCEYNDMSGYGSKVRLFLCRNTKHESISVVRQTWGVFTKEWIEEEMTFDSDSFEFLEDLISGERKSLGGVFSLVRDY